MSKEKTYAEIIMRLSAWSSDELEAVQAMLVRFERGRAQHGGWTKEAKMDYRKERLEEIMDLTWYGSMMDAAHPAPPDPAPVPLTPGHAASCDCPDCILALCDERYCEPDAPPAVASGERSLGEVLTDMLRRAEGTSVPRWEDLCPFAKAQREAVANDFRAAVLAEVQREPTAEEVALLIDEPTEREVVRKADAIRSRGLRPGGARRDAR